MTDRTNAAYARGDRRHFTKWPVFHQLLEPAKLSNVKARRTDSTGVIEMDGDLAVPFNPGHGSIVIVLLRRSYSQAPKRVMVPNRPATRQEFGQAIVNRIVRRRAAGE